jgi:hypothetical protein
MTKSYAVFKKLGQTQEVKMIKVNPAILDEVVEGFNLPPTPFYELISEQPTLIAFLRHFG